MQILNEDDLRDCFAMMLTMGFAVKGEINPKAVWEIADMILEARKDKDESGIASVKRTRKTK